MGMGTGLENHEWVGAALTICNTIISHYRGRLVISARLECGENVW